MSLEYRDPDREIDYFDTGDIWLDGFLNDTAALMEVLLWVLLFYLYERKRREEEKRQREMDNRLNPFLRHRRRK